MTEQTILESGSIEAIDFASHFFEKIPHDSRTIQTKYEAFKPTGSYENTSLSFTLPQLMANDIYRLQDSLLEVHVKLVTTDGASPADKALVTPVNNVLFSLFSEVEVQFNTTVVTKDSGGYAYMCYLHNLLNFDIESKLAQLQAPGSNSSSIGPLKQDTCMTPIFHVFM
jgi:hypothetical protein